MTGVERAGARAVAAVIARLADRLRAEMPRARVEEQDDGVTITARGIADEPALRWPAGLLR